MLFPHATGPVIPIICPGSISKFAFFSTSGIERPVAFTLHGAFCGRSRSSGGVQRNPLMRLHDTCACCTALNSLAALEDFTDSFAKQAINVVNAAMSHAPLCTRAPPRYRINSTPVMESALYSGGSADTHILALTAHLS